MKVAIKILKGLAVNSERIKRKARIVYDSLDDQIM